LTEGLASIASARGRQGERGGDQFVSGAVIAFDFRFTAPAAGADLVDSSVLRGQVDAIGRVRPYHPQFRAALAPQAPHVGRFGRISAYQAVVADLPRLSGAGAPFPRQLRRLVDRRRRLRDRGAAPILLELLGIETGKLAGRFAEIFQFELEQLEVPRAFLAGAIVGEAIRAGVALAQIAGNVHRGTSVRPRSRAAISRAWPTTITPLRSTTTGWRNPNDLIEAATLAIAWGEILRGLRA